MDGVPAKRDSWSSVKHKGMAQKAPFSFLEKFRRMTSKWIEICS